MREGDKKPLAPKAPFNLPEMLRDALAESKAVPEPAKAA